MRLRRYYFIFITSYRYSNFNENGSKSSRLFNILPIILIPMSWLQFKAIFDDYQRAAYILSVKHELTKFSENPTKISGMFNNPLHGYQMVRNSSKSFL